jgi:hypothetical protein
MKMNMDLIEKFVQDARWLARYIELKITLSEASKLTYSFVYEDNSPNKREQKDIILWLLDLGVISNLCKEEKTLGILQMNFLQEREHIGYSFDIDRTKLTATIDILKDEQNDAKTVIEQVKLLAKSTPVKQSSVEEQVVPKLPLINEEKRVVTFSGKTTKPIAGQNQWVLCRALCTGEIGDWVKENDVIGDFTDDNDTALYDAHRALNRIFEDTFRMKDLIEYKSRTARINPDKLKI